MKYIPAFALLCSSVLSSCSKSENAGYNQVYSLSLNKADSTITATASFRHPSDFSQVILDKGASVTFNGIASSYSERYKSYYWPAGTWSQNNVFMLTTTAGRVIRNEISGGDINHINFGMCPDTISRSSGFVFSWDGPEMMPGETIMYALYDNEKSIGRDISSGHEVSYTREDLQNLHATDSGVLSMTRRGSINLKEFFGNSGGSIGVSVAIKRKIVIKD